MRGTPISERTQEQLTLLLAEGTPGAGKEELLESMKRFAAIFYRKGRPTMFVQVTTFLIVTCAFF